MHILIIPHSHDLASICSQRRTRHLDAQEKLWFRLYALFAKEHAQIKCTTSTKTYHFRINLQVFYSKQTDLQTNDAKI